MNTIQNTANENYDVAHIVIFVGLHHVGLKYIWFQFRLFLWKYKQNAVIENMKAESAAYLQS